MIYSNQKSNKKELYKPLTGIFLSIKGGIIGFSIISTLIILTKLLSISLNSSKNFNFDLTDFVISLWGFIVLSFIVFAVENKKN